MLGGRSSDLAVEGLGETRGNLGEATGSSVLLLGSSDLGGVTNVTRENPNAARAAAAAAKPPSGDYYLSPTQEQSKEQFEEMQRRRDEWNDRVQRAVKRKDEARDEEALDDGA